jgi:3-oxoacyl-[acyl-carrier protein] reductase
MGEVTATTVASDAFDLTGKVAVLTGGASGIGRATAQVLAAAGAAVVLGDVDEKGAQATADDITSRGGSALPVRTDVTERADVDALVDRAAGEYGRVDVMGNIAGVPHNQMVVDVTDEEFERILAINLKSVFYGCQAAMRVMVPQRAGNIVNILSGAIDTPAPTLACYGMTKAAVAMLTPREREIASAVADGRTNAEIAYHWHISEHTVAKHVASILAKIGLRSRVQIARWAVETGLVEHR